MENQEKPKEVIVSATETNTDPSAPVRVAFYVRVSKHSEEQMHSFENQMEAVQVVLKQHPEFRLVKVYADAGITGTLTEKRLGFLEMIADCEEGKIDLIYTKSLSRWSRNTVECLRYYRMLKGIGVNLIFEKECIDTRNVFSEMALTIYASFSQEESRSISENIKMAIRWRFGMGECRWISVFGYSKGFVVVEPEAAVIRKIYDLYEHGTSVRLIMIYLNENGIPSPRNAKWSARTINNILKNEKYIGDLVMQKYYTVDHLTHHRVRNDGTLVPIYTIPDHHKAIISREQFRRVQQIMAIRLSGKYGLCQYPFGDRLFCPYCGSRLKQHDFQNTVWAKGRGWECVECHEFLLKAQGIEKLVMEAYADLNTEKIRANMSRMKPERRKAAEKLIKYKESGEVKEPHFYWIDDLIDRIEFGTFATKAERVIKIRWKFGLISTRPSRSRKTPKEYAALANGATQKIDHPGMEIEGNQSEAERSD